MKTNLHVCTYLERNLLNTYRKKGCYGQKLWRKMKYILCLMSFFGKSCVFGVTEQRERTCQNCCVLPMFPNLFPYPTGLDVHLRTNCYRADAIADKLSLQSKFISPEILGSHGSDCE
jgi:hypothetical protein